MTSGETALKEALYEDLATCIEYVFNLKSTITFVPVVS